MLAFAPAFANFAAMGTDLFFNLALVGTNFVVAVLIGATAIAGLLVVSGIASYLSRRSP